MITIVLEKFEYLGKGTMLFETVCVKILKTLLSTTYAKMSRIWWFIVDDVSRSGPQILHKSTFIYSVEGFCSGQNQKAKFLKIAPNSYRSVVLNPKARAHKSLIRDRKPGHKLERVFITYEISLYCLIRPIMVLSVSICRVSIAVYTQKILARKTLLLMNGEIYNVYGLHQL